MNLEQSSGQGTSRFKQPEEYATFKVNTKNHSRNPSKDDKYQFIMNTIQDLNQQQSSQADNLILNKDIYDNSVTTPLQLKHQDSESIVNIGVITNYNKTIDQSQMFQEPQTSDSEEDDPDKQAFQFKEIDFHQNSDLIYNLNQPPLTQRLPEEFQQQIESLQEQVQFLKMQIERQPNGISQEMSQSLDHYAKHRKSMSSRYDQLPYMSPPKVDFQLDENNQDLINLIKQRREKLNQKLAQNKQIEQTKNTQIELKLKYEAKLQEIRTKRQENKIDDKIYRYKSKVQSNQFNAELNESQKQLMVEKQRNGKLKQILEKVQRQIEMIKE